MARHTRRIASLAAISFFLAGAAWLAPGGAQADQPPHTSTQSQQTP